MAPAVSYFVATTISVCLILKIVSETHHSRLLYTGFASAVFKYTGWPKKSKPLRLIGIKSY